MADQEGAERAFGRQHVTRDALDELRVACDRLGVDVRIAQNSTGSVMLEVTRAHGPLAMIASPDNLCLEATHALLLVLMASARVRRCPDALAAWAAAAGHPLDPADPVRSAQVRAAYERARRIRTSLKHALGSAYVPLTTIAQQALGCPERNRWD
jgi:hypothetical protein